MGVDETGRMEVGRPRFFISVVPTGLALLMLPKPGTEVPGYYHCVPTGLKCINSRRGSKTLALDPGRCWS